MKISHFAVGAIIAMFVAAAASGALYVLGFFDRSEASLEAFFARVEEGKLYDAYRECAAILRTNSFETFERSISTLGLNQLRDVEWSGSTGSPAGTEKTYRGTAKLDNGTAVPLTVRTVREAGGWKIFEIESDQKPLLFSEEKAKPLPPIVEIKPNEKQLEALVLDTLVKFNEAVQIRYFGPFFQSISSTWQQQTTPEELQTAFQAFIDNRVNFGGVTRLRPVKDGEMTISKEGLLETIGHFVLPEYTLGYRMQFVYERGKWKLFAINLDLKLPEAAGVSSEQ